MQWDEVDNSYVKVAQKRIGRALERSTSIPVRIWPAPIEQDVAGQSFWVVLAVLVKTKKITNDLNDQVWRVYAELLYRPHVQQYDPTIYTEPSQIYATAHNYLFAHQGLKFEDADEDIPYHDGNADIEMNAMNLSGQPGASLVVELTFKVNIEQEYT